MKEMIAKILLSIGALLAIALITLAIIQVKNQREVSQIWRSLEAVPIETRFNKDMVAELPAPVQRYFFHAIALQTPLATSVSLKMNGNFRLSQDKTWLPMEAKEIVSASIGFVWKAVIGNSLMQMRGGDYYINNSGQVQFSLWGIIPLVNTQNMDTNRSAIGRLAGETIWLPSALLPQRGVSWQAINETTIQAILKIDGEPIILTLFIDSQGRLLKMSFPRWGDRTDDGSFAYIPFGGEFQAESTFAGFTIPAEMSLGWWFGTDRYAPFFRATIEQAKFR